MADLVTQDVDLDGANQVLGAANGGGDKFVPGENTFLVIKNGGGSSITATVVTPKEAAEGIAEADVAIAVPAGETHIAGPFPAKHFANPSDSGKAAITYSGVTSVTVGCFKL